MRLLEKDRQLIKTVYLYRALDTIQIAQLFYNDSHYGQKFHIIHSFSTPEVVCIDTSGLLKFNHETSSPCYTKHMRTTILKYNVIITKEGRSYIAYVPTLDLSDFGKTVEEAKKNVIQAIACHLEGLQKTGTEIPATDLEFPYVSQTEVIFPHKIIPAL